MKKTVVVINFIIILLLSSLASANEDFQITGMQLSSAPTLNYPVKITANCDTSNLYYQFFICSDYGSPDYEKNWQILQPWSGYNYCTWIPTSFGRYLIVVWVTDDLATVGEYDCEIIGLSTEVKALSLNLNGNYSGTCNTIDNGYPYSFQVNLTLSQSGNSVSGTWLTSDGSSGTLTGTIQGNTSVSMNFVQINPCAGRFNGSVAIMDNGSKLSGSFSGVYCEGSLQASFVVQKY